MPFIERQRQHMSMERAQSCSTIEAKATNEDLGLSSDNSPVRESPEKPTKRVTIVE